MNILIVSRYQNDGSPTAIFIHDQAKAYSRLGHHVRVIVPVALGKRDYMGRRILRNHAVIDGIDHVFVHHLSISRYGDGGFNAHRAIDALRLQLPAVLDGFCPDVIHAHTLGLESTIGAWLKGKLGCPLVITTHGSDTAIPLAHGKSAQLKAWSDAADTVVAVSSTLGKKLQTSGTETPVLSILNGFAPHFQDSLPDKEPLHLIQVGNLIKSKRVDATIRALSLLRKRHPGAALTVIGQGPERTSLETLSEALGVSEAVRFCGQLPNEEVLSKMDKAAFFVMVSKPEGFGIVYLEAMASGCVTIGTEGEGIADLIVSGENGFLVPPDDPDAIAAVIEWCIQHPEEAAAIAERGRQAATGLTWEKNAAQYAALFQALIDGR